MCTCQEERQECSKRDLNPIHKGARSAISTPFATVLEARFRKGARSAISTPFAARESELISRHVHIQHQSLQVKGWRKCAHVRKKDKSARSAISTPFARVLEARFRKGARGAISTP